MPVEEKPAKDVDGTAAKVRAAYNVLIEGRALVKTIARGFAAAILSTARRLIDGALDEFVELSLAST
jgi:hypothetical protein